MLRDLVHIAQFRRQIVPELKANSSVNPILVIYIQIDIPAEADEKLIKERQKKLPAVDRSAL